MDPAGRCLANFGRAHSAGGAYIHERSQLFSFFSLDMPAAVELQLDIRLPSEEDHLFSSCLRIDMILVVH